MLLPAEFPRPLLRLLRLGSAAQPAQRDGFVTPGGGVVRVNRGGTLMGRQRLGVLLLCLRRRVGMGVTSCKES